MMCRTPKAACWLRLGRWSNNIANSHPSPGPIDCRVLRSYWCCSAHTHLIDPTINDALRIVTGCLRPTPADNLPILAGIQSAELRRNGATLSLGCCAMELAHPSIKSTYTRPSSAVARRLKSRHPFVPAAQQLISLSVNNNIRAVQLADHQWDVEWADNSIRLRTLIPDTGTHPSGMTLPRRAWV